MPDCGSYFTVGGMNSLKKLYYRICDLFFFKRFKIFRADPALRTPKDDSGLRLAFLSIDEYLEWQKVHGRRPEAPSGLNYRADFHRIAALVDGKGRAVCWGWISSGVFSNDNPHGSSSVQVPWEAALKVDIGPKEAYFWSYWTPPEFRRKGYYSTLLLRLREWCMEQPASTLSIYCNATNISSIGGITKAGFEPFDDIWLCRIWPFHLVNSGLDGVRLLMSGQRIRLVGDSQPSLSLTKGLNGAAKTKDRKSQKKGRPEPPQVMLSYAAKLITA